jgi:hypothetical protein
MIDARHRVAPSVWSLLHTTDVIQGVQEPGSELAIVCRPVLTGEAAVSSARVPAYSTDIA